jgi:DNA-directed RNA polymerase specialized sigma24 family protein
MNAVIITIMALLGAFIIFAFAKMARINNRIDDIFNKALTMQGEIEANTARAKDNYKLIAQVNTEVENVKNTIAELHKQEPTDEPAKEVEAELESLVPEQEEEVSDKELGLIERRECFAHLRSHGVSLHDAADVMHISYSTAKRYEQWRKDNKK